MLQPFKLWKIATWFLVVVFSFLIVACQSQLTANATLTVRSGKIQIDHKDAAKEELQAGQTATINPADNTITAQGSGLISFGPNNLATLSFEEGAKFSVADLNTVLGTLQSRIVLSAGQFRFHLEALGATDNQAKFVLGMAAGDFQIGSFTNRSQEFLIWLTPQTTRIGVLAGQATLNNNNKNIVFNESDGMTIQGTTPPGDPVAWSRVKIPVYRPDGTATTLPIVLASSDSIYRFNADQMSIVPNGVYTLTVDDPSLLQPFRMDKLTLPILAPKTLSEIPITLSEAALKLPSNQTLVVVDSSNTVAGSRSVPANTRLLISPGPHTITINQADRPAATQQVTINLIPGQGKDLDISPGLFGAGRFQVRIVAPDGSTLPGEIAIFSKQNDSGTVLSKFTTDKTSDLLPEDKYIIYGRFQPNLNMPVRIEASINEGKTYVDQQAVDTVDIKLGTLALTTTKGPLYTYIASSKNIDDLKIPHDVNSIIDARRSGGASDYIYALRVLSRSQAFLPEGKYSIFIDGQKDYALNNVVITARQTTVINLDNRP